MPPPVRVAAPALGPVARPVAGEERVSVGPDVIGRQLGLETAEVPKRVVLAAEHDDVGAALADGYRNISTNRSTSCACSPSRRPLAQNAHAERWRPGRSRTAIAAGRSARAPGNRGRRPAAAGPAADIGTASCALQCSRQRSLSLSSGRYQAGNFTLKALVRSGTPRSTRSVPIRGPRWARRGLVRRH